MEAARVKTKSKKKRDKPEEKQQVEDLKTEKDVDSCEEAVKAEPEAAEALEHEEENTKRASPSVLQAQIGDFDRLLTENKKIVSEIVCQEVTEPREIKPTPKIIIKPYTEPQLAALYTNSELEILDGFTNQFVEAELKGLALKRHPLYELLATYLHVRAKITGNNLELEQMRKEYRDLQSMLWTTDTATVTGRGECADGSHVTATHSYQKATFHRSVFQCIVRILGLVRKLTYENHTLYSYSVEDLRLQIELYIQTAIHNCVTASGINSSSPIILTLENEPQHLKPFLSEIRLCISVLFAFQRKLIRDQQFIKESREWLSRLVAILLRLANYQDHLFLLSHILRCPAGVGSWASSFIQTPLEENLTDSPFSSYQINHILSILTMILSPIKERERFLEDLSQSQDNPESIWIVVDSEGEEDDESGTSLRENDLVALLSQLPLENLFRNLLLVERRNFENSFDFSKINQHHILRFFAFSTVLLKVLHKGLKTYDQGRYNQFAKRLSRMIRHVVQYATDQWEQFRKCPNSNDQAMLERLQVEYDAFFLRAIYYLYTSQKLGAWQFLAVIPYNLITIEALWKIFYFLHDSDTSALEILNPDAEAGNYQNRFWIGTFRTQFEEKLSSLADDELYYLLNTYANMALAREENDFEFIKTATKDLLEVGFISRITQEICSKSARTLLTHLTSKYPVLLSLVLKEIRSNIQTTENLALYLYEELPLTVWKLSEDDLAVISSLFSSDIQSVESKLGRMIISRLNWDILPYQMHCDAALLALSLIDKEFGYNQWAWQTVLRLKLHINDKSFTDMKRVLEPSNYSVLNRGLQCKQPLASFVAVLMTSWGHLIPLICGNGLPQLLFLQSQGKHEAVLFALYLIVPLFINSQECIINNEKFQEIISNLVNADRGYISMAKSLISVQNTVLQQFGNMIETQIVNFANYDLSSPRYLVRLWFNTLISIPSWSRDAGVLYLLDVVVRAAFFHQDATEAVTIILRELVQNSPSQEQSGAISSLVKWVSNTPTSPTLIHYSLSTYPWLAFLVFEIEFEDREKKSGLWRELLLQLNSQKGKVNVDAAIKKAASLLKVPSFTSSYLSIYRWAQQAMDTPVDHPLLPLMWQKFFNLYLARLPVSVNDQGCVGEKFFDGLVNFAFFKRIKKKLQECSDSYQEKLTLEEEPNRKLFLESCLNLFKAFSAWLEEPKLQKGNLHLPSLPPLYLPNLLSFIIQGSTSSWYEYVYYDKIKTEQLECVRIWQVSNFRHKSNINKPLADPGKSMESSDPIERILRRLTVYEIPKNPPAVKNHAPLVPIIDFTNKETMFRSLDQCFKTLKQFAHNQTLKVSEHKALDCSYQELVPQLYRSVLHKVNKKVPCRGRNETVNCSGAAVIVLEMQEARVDQRIDHQIQTNRNAYESLLAKSLQPPATALCTASVTIQQAIKVLQAQILMNPSTTELGSDLFYHILSLINDETSNYLPTKTLFATCLEKLGRSHICGVEYEMPKLLERILKEPSLGCYLAPHFSPSNIGTANLLYMYATICKEIGNSYDVAFALLSKFEIDKWLNHKSPKLCQRSEFIQTVVKSLTILGFDPPVPSLMLHGLYRKHLLTVFEFQFPEHYGEILINLLKASNGNSDASLLAKSVWFDVINSLARPGQINFKGVLKDQLRQYAQNQKMLHHQELLETSELFAKHFTQERLQYGLYGLYPKSRNYIDVYAILLGMTGHGLITTFLNTHQGLLGDKLVQKIWPYLANMFTPWILPYSMQNLKENMASWIQQLADDRSILLPWIPSDSPLAQKMISVFYECLQFLLYTLPACDTILSFIWQWYAANFAHAGVKDHILAPLHQVFQAFPWESFWPSLNDLDHMLRVIDQYLPECHSFLGHIFMSVKWNVWLVNFKNSPEQVKARVSHCFLHLLVKLSNEPNVRSKYGDKVKNLLMDGENLDWSFLEVPVLQQVVDWYVLSCEPAVIFRSDPLDIDFRVLSFLRTVSGYHKPTNNVENFSKRLIFVKSYVKLLSVYVNRNKSLVGAKEIEIRSVITHQLEHLENVVQNEDEFNNILRELLGFISICRLSVKCFESWLLDKSGDSLPVRGLFQVSGISVQDKEALGFLLETTIASYFKNCDNFEPSWIEISKIMKVTCVKTEFEQILLTKGYILTLYGLFLQKIEKCKDVEVLLNLAISWMENIKVSGSETEVKIPLLWFGIIKLALMHCEKDEPVTGMLLYRFAKNLLQLSEEKGGSRWGRGLLTAIGISKQEAISIKFTCRALAAYILAQLPEMKGQPQVVRQKAYAPARVGQTGGNAECAKVLMSLDLGQAGKMKECVELVLRKIQDAENSLHNAGKFLEMLVKQFYMKPFLKFDC